MNLRDFDPGPLASVDCVVGGERPTLVFVRDLRHAPETVWSALTDPNQLGRWAPYTADRNLGTTGPATLRMLGGEPDEHADLPGVVTRADPPHLLEYTWGTDRLQWQLDAVETGTRLTLHHTVEAEDWIPKVAAGWHLCLVVAERLLDGDPIPPIVGEDTFGYGWQQLHDEYAAKLGIVGTGFPHEGTSAP